MNRFFTKKQRLTLAKFAKWKCQICNIDLDMSFHADHIIPFSKGGSTDVCNGQALCATCNIQKGNKMAFEGKLRDWQERALETAVTLFTKAKSMLLQATPGGGKTVSALSIYDKIKEAYDIDFLIVVVPSSLLRTHWIDDASSMFNTELANHMLYDGRGGEMEDYEGFVMTYHGVNNAMSDLQYFVNKYKVMVIADEVHHVSDANSWGESFQEAFGGCEKLLMLTGTPWTADKGFIPFVSYKPNGYVKTDFQYTKSEAIADRVCREVVFNKRDKFEHITTTDGNSYTTIKEALDDTGKDPYSLVVTKAEEVMMLMFKDANEQLNSIREFIPDAGGLLVAPNIQVAHDFQELLEYETGVKYTIVTSKPNDSDDIKEAKREVKASEKIDKFRASREPWLISVNMVSEGIDIKRLMVCVYLSGARTELLFRQITGRIERVRTPNRELDLKSYMFTLSHPQLDENIVKMKEENDIGIEARETFLCSKCENDPCTCVPVEYICKVCNTKPCICKKTDSLFEDILLDAMDKGTVEFDGVLYTKDEVLYAYDLRNKSKEHLQIPMFALLMLAKAELGSAHEPIKKKKPNMAKQIEILKKQITDNLNRKLGLQGLLTYPKVFAICHSNLNKAIGIERQAVATKKQLKKKLKAIKNTGDMKIWMR